MTPARKSRSRLIMMGEEGNRIDGMFVQFWDCHIDRRSERRTISPRLGAFRDLLIAAITVIIDLLRAWAITIGPRYRKQPSRECIGLRWGTRELRRAADSASGGNRIWKIWYYAVLCRRPVQWVIQSVGRRQRADNEKFNEGRCELTTRYLAASSECH